MSMSASGGGFRAAPLALVLGLIGISFVGGLILKVFSDRFEKESIRPGVDSRSALGHQLAVEFHNLGVEISDISKVRIASAKIINRETNALIPDLSQGALTTRIVLHWDRLRDLEINRVPVNEYGVIGAKHWTSLALRGLF